MGTLDDLTEEKLRRLYWEEEMSQIDISKIYDCSYQSIQYYMNKWDIETRSISEANTDSDVNNLSKQKAKTLYWDQKLSTVEIANKYGTDASTIRKKLLNWGIEVRNKKEAKEVDWERGKQEVPKSFSFEGHTHGKEARKKMSEARSGENCYWHGKSLSKEHKKKIRKSHIKRLRNEDIRPKYNRKACNLFDKLNKTFGWGIRHAENGGEKYVDCGFWVDGYEPKLNLVIEYDESHHFRVDKLKEKDIKREQKIKNELDCKFVRIREETQEAYRGPNKLIEQINGVIDGSK